MAKMTVLHRTTVGLENRASGQAFSADGLKTRVSALAAVAKLPVLDLGRRGNRTSEEIETERDQKALARALPASVTSLAVGGILACMSEHGLKRIFSEPEIEQAPRPAPQVSLSRRPRMQQAFNPQGKN